MLLRTTLTAGTLAAMAMFIMPTLAAAQSTTIKVALTDLSSAAGAGRSGMMGGGWGWQGGQGPGQMGPGMMGPGMMGGGMMGGGMMAIRINQSTVKAGDVHFDVTNWSQSVVHEMLVVAVDNPNAALPYDPVQGRVPENQIKVLGEAEEMRPNESKTLDLKLTPGTYLLICNVPGHYAQGMLTALTVTP